MKYEDTIDAKPEINQSMKYIEFLGIPGSGKSTLCRNLVGSLQKNGHDIYGVEQAVYNSTIRQTNIPYIRILNNLSSNPINKIVKNLIFMFDGVEKKYLCQFFLRNPHLAKLIFRNVSKNAPSEDKKQMYAKWFCKTIVQYELACQYFSDGETFLFDEGFANRSITLFHYQADSSKKDIRQYATHIPQPDLLIVPEVPIETACARMNQREKGFPPAYQKVNQKTRLDILQYNSKLVNIVSQELYRQGCEVYYIDNDRKLSSTIHEAQEKIENTIT